MTKQTHARIHENRSVWTRGHGSPGRLRTRVVVALATVWLLVPIGAAAVELVDVRVGQHPGFTRVVFEFDEPTGYQVSRSQSGEPSLLVKLDARSQPAQFSYDSGLVASLDLGRQQSRASAQLVLREKGFRLKEMTLIDPFRVVIDVLPAASAKTTAARPKAAAPKQPAAKPAPAKAAAVRAPKPEVRKSPAPKPVAKATERPAKPVAKAPAVATAPSSRPAQPAPPKAVSKKGEPSAVKPKPMVKTPTAEKAVVSKGPEVPRVRNQSASPAPVVVQTESEEGGFPWLLSMVILVLLLGGTAFAVSRRRGGAEFDESVFDELAPEPSESPFRVLESGSEPEPEQEVSESASEPFVLTAEDQEETTELDPPVDTVSQGFPVLEGIPVEESEEGALEPAAAAAATEEFARVLKEVESRLSALEGQLSEYAEWKPGVEKRIAAQTEELRVQRAAIARTQRAVRQLSRPTEVSATAPDGPPEQNDAPTGEEPDSV